MDFRLNSNSSIFTNRELRRYRSLYRSRTLQQTEILNKNEVKVIIYGSIALLSSNIRPLIRKIFTKASWQYKIYLFSNSLSQSFTSTSYLKERGSLLKGSSFFRVISFSIPETQPRHSEFAYINSQLSEISKRFDLINKSANESISEVNYLNPVLLYRTTKYGAISPIRFSETRLYINQQVTNLDILGQQLKYLSGPTLQRHQLIIKPQLSILNKISSVQLSIINIIRIIANKH